MPGEVRLLPSGWLPDVMELVNRDPIANCYVGSRLMEGPRGIGGELWGWVVEGRLESVLFAGANLVPVATTPLARVHFADRARRMGRRCSSLVGPADQVLDLWRLLEPDWGPAREVRARQHLMATATSAMIPADPRVRPLLINEIDVLMPAAVAMFTEEVGISPVASGGVSAYRYRLGELVRAGRSLGIVSGERVLFKAEVGAVTPACAQVQGVWVTPELRGQGLGAAGMAAVVEYTRARVAPVVSLYVNDYNTRAVATYLRVGFQTVGQFATVLF